MVNLNEQIRNDELSQISGNRQDVYQELQQEIYLSLGGDMVDIELDPAHYNLAIKKSFERFRQRSGNATEESFIFLELQPEVGEYYLPKEVREVRQICRRGIGSQGNTGTYFEPFSMGMTNLYLLEAGRLGGLATYDFYNQFRETMGRMFGTNIMFNFNPVNGKLTIMRKMLHPEQVALWVYNYRPDSALWQDDFAKNWLRRWAIAECKMMIGEARSKFSQIAGPSGGTTLNGDAMKTEASAEFETLELEILNYVTGGEPLGFVIG